VSKSASTTVFLHTQNSFFRKNGIQRRNHPNSVMLYDTLIEALAVSVLPANKVGREIPRRTKRIRTEIRCRVEAKQDDLPL
jgi:hypothetical protein